MECRKVLSSWLNRSLGFISISLFWIWQPHEATLGNNNISELSNKSVDSSVLENSQQWPCVIKTHYQLIVLCRSYHVRWLPQTGSSGLCDEDIYNKIAGNWIISCFSGFGTTVLTTLAFIYKLVSSCVQDGCHSSRPHTFRLLSQERRRISFM